MACPQSHNDHLVFSRKEVVCILSVVKRVLLKPFSPLPFFHYGLSFLKRDFMQILRQLPTILRRSVSLLVPILQWDGVHWMSVNSVDCCSVDSHETSISISLFLGFCSTCKTDKATEMTTALGCTASCFFKEQLGRWLQCICFSLIPCRKLSRWNGLLDGCPIVGRDIDSSTSIPGSLFC